MESSSPGYRDWTHAPALEGGFLTSGPSGSPRVYILMIVITAETDGQSTTVSFLVYLFAPLLVLKIHLLFSVLSWLLGIHHWLIPALSELRVLSGQKDWRFSLFLKTHPPALVLFFLPPHWQSWVAHLWIGFSLSPHSFSPENFSTTSWESSVCSLPTPGIWEYFFSFLVFLILVELIF